MRGLGLAVVFALVAGTASAQCRTAITGAGCVVVPESQRTARQVAAPVLARAEQPALVSVGEIVDRGRYSMVLNASYYGLPPVADGWVYMKIGSRLYRVDWQSHQVLEDVTLLAAANF